MHTLLLSSHCPIGPCPRFAWPCHPRRTRVRDQLTGKTYNLGDRLLGLRPYVRRGLHEIRTACELAISMSYRLARYRWQRLTGRRCSLINFWRMVRRRFDLRRTPNQLFLCDGEDGLLRLPGRYFREALVQLDRFHVHRQLGRAFGLDTPGYRTALKALWRANLSQVRSLLALRGVGLRRAVCQEVRGYLDRHESFLWTHRSITETVQ